MTHSSQALVLTNQQATLDMGRALAKSLQQGGFIYLMGDLGAGKTTLCQGIIQGLGYSGIVKSPTYTLVEPYALNAVQIYHFDLYRLLDVEELEYIGARDYFAEGNICLVEWANRAPDLLPIPDLRIYLKTVTAGRHCTVIAETNKGESMMYGFVRKIK